MHATAPAKARTRDDASTERLQRRVSRLRDAAAVAAATADAQAVGALTAILSSFDEAAACLSTTRCSQDRVAQARDDDRSVPPGARDIHTDIGACLRLAEDVIDNEGRPPGPVEVLAITRAVRCLRSARVQAQELAR